MAYTLLVGLTSGKGTAQTYGLYERYEQYLYNSANGLDKGATIQMTIDSDLQEYAYSLLSAYNKRGSVIIMEAKTGKIKALAFTPSVNGNKLSKDWENELKEAGGTIKPLMDPVVPGSIYKITTSTGILEQGLEDITINDKGSIAIGNGKLSNASNASYGNISLQNAFLHSSNVYFGTMGLTYLKQSGLADLADRFLIGKTLKLDFATVKSTFNPDEKEFSDLEVAWSSIGQNEVKLTCVNAAMLAQTIANDGVMLKPYAIDTIYQGEGEDKITYLTSKTEEYKTVTDESIAQKLRSIMKATGEYYVKNKTGKTTFTAGGKEISLGMKTGTGEIGGNKNNSIWITSMAPADDPEYIVAMNIYDSDQAGKSLLPDIISLYQKAMKK
jgi:peptidoglycan glycosyltransferase